MGTGQVEYIKPTIIYPLSSKSSSFISDQFPLNNNPNCSITLITSISSSFTGFGTIQGSLDGQTWFDLNGTTATINGDDEILWILNAVQSLMYVRLSVVVSTGSSIVQALARGA